jgi:hypothetical protein
MQNRDLDPIAESLHALPQHAPPGKLTDRLRVMASRESLRRRRTATPKALLGWWAERIGLFFNNLLRPVAVPFAGGLLSAVILLLTVLAPVYPIQRHDMIDVPSPILTQPMVLSFFSLPDYDEDMMVDVWIDEQGRIRDYSIPAGQGWAGDPSTVRSVEATLLCTKFSPATLFGQPASGKIRITFRRSHLEVRG